MPEEEIEDPMPELDEEAEKDMRRDPIRDKLVRMMKASKSLEAYAAGVVALRTWDAQFEAPKADPRIQMLRQLKEEQEILQGLGVAPARPAPSGPRPAPRGVPPEQLLDITERDRVSHGGVPRRSIIQTELGTVDQSVSFSKGREIDE